MKLPVARNRLLVIAWACMLPAAVVCAQTGGPKNSYRITPPLRVASRPVDGLAPRGVTQADPFRPREKKENPATLAVQGYSLVSLRDQQQWVQGSPQVQAVIGGKVYLFKSIRERDIFLAAPELYLPVLDGDCIVTFAETGERVSGELEHGLVHGKRVYFFADQARLQSFQAAPDDYKDADLVDSGACVVSKMVDKRYAPGLPQTVAIVDGRRYFFASAFQRRIFERNPMPFLVQPLRNPFAAAALEVPALAEVLDNGALEFAVQGSPTIVTSTSPSNLVKLGSKKKKGSNAQGEEESNGHEDFMRKRAMSGYCPVTIRTQNTWRRGKVKFRHTFDGKIYFLAGSEELAAFQANPNFYAPVLSGDSVVAMATSSERVAGSVFHAFIYKERLYLFATEAERQTFRENPAQFESADLAAQGICMVSRIEDKQEVVGVAEFETLYSGKRYRFASAAYLKKFLANPKVYAEE